MASQPGTTVRSLSFVTTAFLISGLAFQSASWGAPPADPAACIYQFAPPTGDAYFALAVRAERGQLPASEIRQHVILVDTSASQGGAYRKRSMEMVDGYLAALRSNDRVKLFAIDIKAQPMMESFAAPQADATRNAREELASRAPLGATDLLAGLKTVLADLPSGDRAAVVYIGDGMSAARLADASAVSAAAADFHGRRIAISSFAVGPQTDLEFLGTLAQLTGGAVLLDGRGRNGETIVTGADLAEVARSPVGYPTRMIVEGQHIELLPHTPLPIRSDRSTVYLGKGRAQKGLGLSFQFAETGPAPLTIRVGDSAPRTANGVLSILWNRAQSTGGIVAPLAGGRLIAAAEDAFDDRVAALVNQGERAVAVRDAATVEQLARDVRAMDPTNARAAGLLSDVDRLRKETSTRQLRQIAQAPAGASPPPPPRPVDGSLESRKGPPAEGSMSKYGAMVRIRGQQLTQEVNGAIENAKKSAISDPEEGVLNLKRTVASVATATDVEEAVRSALLRRLQDTVLELRSIEEVQAITKVKKAEQLAQVEARRKSLDQMSIEEQRLTHLIDQVRALLVQAVHGDDNAYEEAEAVAREAINLRPGSGRATQAMYNSEAAGQLNKSYRLRNLRADRLLESLYLVELAHVPFPDEPPIEWPNAQVWRALTEKRKKWKSVDLRSESPSEARISQALDQPVEFDISPQPLKDALDFIANRYSIPIILDQKTLDDAGVESTTEVSLNVPNVKLRNMLKLLLEKLPQPLTFVIEDEVMKITTVEKAKDILSIRMYPVGDLIMGPQQLQAMTGGGGMGGRGGMGGGMGMGGMGGGMGMGGMGGGMGMGGMGGGMGGMGGGMFSVPSESPGTDANDAASTPTTSRAAAKSFTNSSVESSKKKLNGAR